MVSKGCRNRRDPSINHRNAERRIGAISGVRAVAIIEDGES